MKKPTKQELYARIEEFEKKEFDEATKREQEFEKMAMRYYDGAHTCLLKKLAASFGRSFSLVKFEHVDRSGFWFSFELIHDNRRQNYRISIAEAKQAQAEQDGQIF